MKRPPLAGYVTGTIRFVDGSQLEFKEFIITDPSLRVIKVSAVECPSP